MKQGIVMEHQRKHTVIMTADGNFQKAKRIKDKSIGEEVYFEPLKLEKGSLLFLFPKKKKQMIRLMAMACIFFVVLIPLLFNLNEDQTYAYVNVDFNPSIELKVDSAISVQSLIPLNESATQLVSELEDYKGQKLEEVILMIMNRSVQSGLVTNGKNMLIGISYVTEELEDIHMRDNLKQHFKEIKSDWDVTAYHVPKEVRELAKKSNKSMNEVMIKEVFNRSKQRQNFSDEEKKKIENFYKNTSVNQTKIKPTQEQVENPPSESEEGPIEKESNSKKNKTKKVNKHNNYKDNKSNNNSKAKKENEKNKKNDKNKNKKGNKSNHKNKNSNQNNKGKSNKEMNGNKTR